MRKLIFWLIVLLLLVCLEGPIKDTWAYIVINYEYVNHLDIP